MDRVSVPEPSHRPPLQRNLRGNSAVVIRCLRRPLQSCLSDMTDIASMFAPTTADCEPANVAKPRGRVVHRTELRCKSFWPATTRSKVRRGRPSLARSRSLSPLQIAARRNGRVDKALSYQLHDMLVHQFPPDLLNRSDSCLMMGCFSMPALAARLEANSVAVEVESAAGRRLCVFRDGLRERVARLFKRIFACDGLRVPVKELAFAVDV